MLENELEKAAKEAKPRSVWSKTRRNVKSRPYIFCATVLGLLVVLALSVAALAIVLFHSSDHVTNQSNSNHGSRIPTETPSTSHIPSFIPSLHPSIWPTSHPSFSPSAFPSSLSTPRLTSEPSPTPNSPPLGVPSSKPSTRPETSTPTTRPTVISDLPSLHPSGMPSSKPSTSPETLAPTTRPTFVSYLPGSLMSPGSFGLRLSQGLTVRLVATAGSPVAYSSGESSAELFHALPDFGATFEDYRPWNAGGWIYVSNSENRTRASGSVGAITFDRHGNILDYKKILSGTRSNCGGGKTPWGAWISCEEYSSGRCWQVDPTGVNEGQIIAIGDNTGGFFESFAHDTRNWTSPQFFVTEDAPDGALRRWRPLSPDWSDPWSILVGEGVSDYLILYPDATGDSGTYEWTNNLEASRQSASLHYLGSEGIEAHDNQLFFVSKVDKTLISLNLDNGSYTRESTRRGLFNGGPDQIKRIIGERLELLYFTEDGGRSGIHARDEAGRYFTVLESAQSSAETTGLAFSPDHRRMYFAYQQDGHVFELQRDDGLPFYGVTLNVRYHNS